MDTAETPGRINHLHLGSYTTHINTKPSLVSFLQNRETSKTFKSSTVISKEWLELRDVTNNNVENSETVNFG